MKTKIIRGIFLVSGLLLVNQCGKRIDATFDYRFIGIWTGNSRTSSYRLSIDDEGAAYWVKNTGRHYESVQGIARIKNGNLRIGIKSFYINQYPKPDSSGIIWTMVLDNVAYAR